MEKLSIIIPVFNEAKTVHLILNKIDNVILPQNIVKEIIIVDDCSTDNTLEIIKNYISTHLELPIELLQHNKNKGKGASLQTGIKNATGNYIIIQDAYHSKKQQKLVRLCFSLVLFLSC
jgi:glycosyltransferase involved in cell wall biosynthesis